MSSSEVKSESVTSLQPQASVSSLPSSSPGPKRSGTTGNTLKKWLTSPVRRLSHGKGDNANAKKPNNKQRKRDGRKSVDLGAQQEDSAEEVGGVRARRDGGFSQASGWRRVKERMGYLIPGCSIVLDFSASQKNVLC